MSAVTNNQNKKNFILEDEVLGMAAEDRNVLINAEQNKKKISDVKTDDQIFEEYIIIGIKELVKFNYDNLTKAINDKLEDYDGDFEDLCKEKRWTKKCLTACKVMDRKIQEKIREIRRRSEFKFNYVRHYKNNYSDGDLNNMWEKGLIFATQDYEKFYRVYNSISV
jgi:hypothetical protein